MATMSTATKCVGIEASKKSYHVFAPKSVDNCDFDTFAEAETYGRLFEALSEMIGWPSHRRVLQAIYRKFAMRSAKYNLNTKTKGT